MGLGVRMIFDHALMHYLREHALSRLLVQTYLTHLLDFEWQDYDYALLCELHLPEFFIESAISKGFFVVVDEAHWK